MSKTPDGKRRSSTEERRVFRSARLEFVELDRFSGMDPVVAELMREVDIASPRLLSFPDWSEQGLEALMLARLPVAVGNEAGHADLNWLANPQVLVTAQRQWPGHKSIPTLVLAHQTSERTRRLVAGGGLFAECAPPLYRSLGPAALYRLWQALIEHDLNPLASRLKMNLVRATCCDPHKLPAVRAVKPPEGSES